MKRIFLTLALAILTCLMLACIVSAQTVYLEEIPDELKVTNDTATHFIVFEEEKYFTGSGATINGLNSDVIAADLASANIDESKIGTEYLTRFNFPAYMGETLVTYVNLNSIKSNKYFAHVCGYVQLEGTVNQVHDMNEFTGQLRCIDFGENSQVKKLPLCFAANSHKLMSVKNFPRNLDSIEKEAFNNCYMAFKGELYINAKTISISAFNNSLSFLTGIVFGPDTQVIGRQSICVRLDEFSSKPADGKLQLKYIEFQCDVSKVTFATQGNNTGSFYFPVSTARSPYSKLECIILSHPDNAMNVKEGSVFNDFTAEGVTILFNDADGLDDYVTASHSYGNASVSYDSFLESGTSTSACTKCTATSTQVLPAIFTHKGYSASETGTPSIMVGFDVNNKALSAYESATGNSITFGIIAAAKESLGANSPLDEGGNPIVLEQGLVIKVPINSGCDILEGKIIGFSSDKYKTAELILSAYIQVTDSDGEIVKIAYLQDKQCDASGLTTVVYNNLLSK